MQRFIFQQYKRLKSRDLPPSLAYPLAHYLVGKSYRCLTDIPTRYCLICQLVFFPFRVIFVKRESGNIWQWLPKYLTIQHESWYFYLIRKRPSILLITEYSWENLLCIFLLGIIFIQVLSSGKVEKHSAQLPKAVFSSCLTHHHTHIDYASDSIALQNLFLWSF